MNKLSKIFMTTHCYKDSDRAKTLKQLINTNQKIKTRNKIKVIKKTNGGQVTKQTMQMRESNKSRKIDI